jgi:hypothetical protein
MALLVEEHLCPIESFGRIVNFEVDEEADKRDA